jgi:large subunit ribosomal protein L30
MSKVRIKQVRSTIKCTEKQKRTMQALGLGKMHRTNELEHTPQIAGMINKVSHLIVVENI